MYAGCDLSPTVHVIPGVQRGRIQVGCPAPGSSPGPGPGGGYRHVQSIASATWTINHSLGHRPVVSATTLAGNELIAEVEHTSTIQTILRFSSPRAGEARLV